jgi:hypothetical protein
MTLSIFPTTQDIGGAGSGIIATEDNMARFGAGEIAGYVISGYNPVTAPPEFIRVMNFSPGEAVISGYRVKHTATHSITVNFNELDQHWYYQLSKNAQGEVNGTQWIRVVGRESIADAPPDSIYVFSCSTNGNTVIASLDQRSPPPTILRGRYIGDGGFQRLIQPIDFVPAAVMISGPGGIPAAQIWAASNLLPGVIGARVSFGGGGEISENDDGLAPLLSQATLHEGGSNGFLVGGTVTNLLNFPGREYGYVAFYGF